MAQLKNISSKDNVSLDNVCYIISRTFTQDSIGQQIPTDTEMMCFCAELPIPSVESFRAGQNGIKSEALILVDSESCEDGTMVKYNDVKYEIYKKYPRPSGLTELYLTRGDNNVGN